MPELTIDSTYGIIIVQDMKAVFADDSYARIYGYPSAQEMLSSIDSFLDLIDPSSHLEAKTNYQNMISGQAIPRGKTYQNIDRHGRHFTVFVIDHIVEWEGKPAIQVTVIDLTALSQANQKIKESQKKFERLITESGQGIMVHRNFKPLFVNQAWVDLVRAESIEWVMELDSILVLVDPEQKQNAINDNKAMMEGCKPKQRKNYVYRNLCFDGSRRYFNVYDNLIEWEGEPALQVVLEDVTERVELEKKLAYRASHDQLTDIYNRTAIYDWLEEVGDHVNVMSCILSDIDDFKRINDKYGHGVGDKVLKMYASLLKEKVGDKGVVARWGGEEFLILIPELELEQTIELAKQINQAFSQIEFSSDKGQFTSSVSIGISRQPCTQPIATTFIDTLIGKADQLMYQAKQQGKNSAKWER